MSARWLARLTLTGLLAFPALAAEPPRSGVQSPAAAASLRFYLPRALLVVVAGGVFAGIVLARRGHVLPSRDVPGLLAFDEAVSRATEMGRPVLFTVGGACDLKRVQLFAAMPLLRDVARRAGELDTRLMVPCCYPQTMPVHINALRDGYIDAGNVEAFRADDVRFFPGEQFFFAIESMGWMLAERPAACFYFGYWEADALLFAETGQTLEAMQIAGTDQLAQIPFFVASCDYTLIGEEFWAASAKLGQDAPLLGSLGAQDLFKFVVVVLIVLGGLLCAVPWIAGRWEQIQGAFR